MSSSLSIDPKIHKQKSMKLQTDSSPPLCTITNLQAIVTIAPTKVDHHCRRDNLFHKTHSKKSHQIKMEWS